MANGIIPGQPILNISRTKTAMNTIGLIKPIKNSRKQN